MLGPRPSDIPLPNAVPWAGSFGSEAERRESSASRQKETFGPSHIFDRFWQPEAELPLSG